MANEQSVHDWLAYEYGDRDFNQLCQALMWQLCARFGSAPVTYASALDAWYASPTDGSGVGPPGSFTYYDIGAYGHVDWVMNSGNAVMGSTRVTEDWGWTNRGWKNGWEYAAETGAGILGWSWVNGANTCPIDGGGGGGGGTTDYAFGLTTECQAALQFAMGVNGPPYYSGPADGVFGENSVKGMQQWLKDLGYLPADYAVDGIPGPAYGTALQELARDRGIPPYTGPIDGAPGENTSISLIGWAQSVSVPDPGPGPDPDPTIPATPDGTFFAPDLGTSQGTFDFNAFHAAGGQAVILKAGGGNASDSPYVAPAYQAQLAAARASGAAIGHYWFNGRENGLTPTTSAQFFVEHADIQPFDIIALDVEDETDTNTAHYTPAEVVEFVDEVARLLPGAKVLIYMNAGDERGSDWSAVVAKGHPLWLASWGANDGSIGTEPDPTYWPTWTLWQYTSNAGPIAGWGSESLDGNVVDNDAWWTYGYDPEDPGPDPDPDPEPGIDEPLREVTAAFFADLETLGQTYKNRVADLPTPEPEVEHIESGGVHTIDTDPDTDPDTEPRHRYRPS